MTEAGQGYVRHPPLGKADGARQRKLPILMLGLHTSLNQYTRAKALFHRRRRGEARGMYDTYPRNELCGRCEHEWASRQRQRTVCEKRLKLRCDAAHHSAATDPLLQGGVPPVLQPPLVCFRSSWVVSGLRRLTQSTSRSVITHSALDPAHAALMPPWCITATCLT